MPYLNKVLGNLNKLIKPLRKKIEDSVRQLGSDNLKVMEIPPLAEDLITLKTEKDLIELYFKSINVNKKTLNLLGIITMLDIDIQNVYTDLAYISVTKTTLIKIKQTEIKTLQSIKRLCKELFTGKIPMKSITVTYNGQYNDEVYTSWTVFNTMLLGLKGYQKIHFTIEWEDGQTHEGKLNVNGDSEIDNFDTNLGIHTANFWKAMAGIQKPLVSWTEVEYQQYVTKQLTLAEESKDTFKKLLETYELG